MKLSVAHWKALLKGNLKGIPFLRRLWRFLRQGYYTVFQRGSNKSTGPLHPIYQVDLRENAGRNLPGRALLSYIVHPFSVGREDPSFLHHINIWHAREIVKVLNEIGYWVDVVDYRDSEFLPESGYDLFVGHGGINFGRICALLPSETLKVYLATGASWEYHNRQELARFAALRERRGVVLKPDRLVRHYGEDMLKAADGIFGTGNDFTRGTFEGLPIVIMAKNTSLTDDSYDRMPKDFEAGRNRFLYYAGPGNVHKGLDLLLEAFLDLDGSHLWICTQLDPGFERAYRDALRHRSNVHVIGWVQPRSQQFYEVMRNCDWCILPSCSEGGVQSVVECMNQGLIPVVSKACGIDVDDFGAMLEPCTINEIARVVKSLSVYPPGQCEVMSRRARAAAITEYSEVAYHENFRDALLRIAQASKKDVLLACG